MSDELKPWTEERMVAKAEALAAHFKHHDIDHYEMSRMIIRDMRQLKDSLQQRVAELEQRISYYEEPPSDSYRCQHRFTEQGICIRCGEDAEEWDAGCVEEIAADVMKAQARIKELQTELARLRAETWQPVSDGVIASSHTTYFGDTVYEQISTHGGNILVANGPGEYDHTQMAVFTAPPNVRLCKRGD